MVFLLSSLKLPPLAELNTQVEELHEIGLGKGSRKNDPHFESSNGMLRCIIRSEELLRQLENDHQINNLTDAPDSNTPSI